MKRLHAEAHMQVGTEELIWTQGKTQRIENIFCFQLQLAVPHLWHLHNDCGEFGLHFTGDVCAVNKMHAFLDFFHSLWAD